MVQMILGWLAWWGSNIFGCRVYWCPSHTLIIWSWRRLYGWSGQLWFCDVNHHLWCWWWLRIKVLHLVSLVGYFFLLSHQGRWQPWIIMFICFLFGWKFCYCWLELDMFWFDVWAILFHNFLEWCGFWKFKCSTSLKCFHALLDVKLVNHIFVSPSFVREQ